MIKITKKSDNKIELTTDMNTSLANAIRRAVNEIPILAVETLEITKNDSALYDEIIAHRMGFVPLKNESIKPDKGIKFKLQAKGPGVVYSDGLVPKGNSVYKMPISILDKNQELEFVAEAKIGTGLEHAKFSPGLIHYRYTEDIETTGDKEKDDEAFRKLIEKAKSEENKELSITIESWGQISPKEMFSKSVEALQKDLKELIKKVK